MRVLVERLRISIPLIVSVAIVLSGGCATREYVPAKSSGNTLTDTSLIRPVVWMQKAAEYNAIRHQNFKLAEYILQHKRVLPVGGSAPAILLELDGIVVDTRPYYAQLTRDDIDYPKNFDQWLTGARLKIFDDAHGFARACADRGIEIYYLAEWDASHINRITELLAKKGFPHADREHVLLEMSPVDRDEFRKDIAATNELLLQIADGLEDVSIVFHQTSGTQRKRHAKWMKDQSGEDFIIFPNPVDGEWIQSIYNYDRELNEEHRNSILRGALDF